MILHTFSSVLSRSFRRKLSMQSLKHFSTRELYIRKLHDKKAPTLETVSYQNEFDARSCNLLLSLLYESFCSLRAKCCHLMIAGMRWLLRQITGPTCLLLAFPQSSVVNAASDLLEDLPCPPLVHSWLLKLGYASLSEDAH